MSNIIGVFSDSTSAGAAVGELKNKGYTQDISIISKDQATGEVDSHQVKEDVSDGAVAGAAIGAAMTGMAALLAGAASFVVPGVGILVMGPLAAALTGAAAGGLVGGLVDWGIPEAKASEYENRVKSGDVLVAVKADGDKEHEVLEILKSHGATDTNDYRKNESAHAME